MSASYIMWKINKDFDIKAVIKRRYIDIKSNASKKIDNKILISNLQKEIYKIYPIIDSKFTFECKSVFKELNVETDQEDDNTLKKELSIKSNNNMKYLEKFLNSGKYWTSQQMDNLKNSHFRFLEKEFFNIIKSFSEPENIPDVYENNLSILDDQIRNDEIKFNLIFYKFEKRQMQKNLIRFVEMEKGSNYTIREKENEKEIKVRVELNGDIENLIPPDY